LELARRILLTFCQRSFVQISFAPQHQKHTISIRLKSVCGEPAPSSRKAQCL
jgi:hypothetical protein